MTLKCASPREGIVAGMVALADCGLFADYVAYATPQASWFAGGAVAVVILERDRVVLRQGSSVTSEAVGDEPLRQVGALLEGLLPPRGHAFGYLSFELSHQLHGDWAVTSGEVDDSSAPLAYFIVPQVEVRWSHELGSVAEVACEDSHVRSHVERLVRDAPGARQGEPASLELRGVADRVPYESAVREVIDAIHDGQLRKAIVSRRLTLPFELDMSATFALGLQHNTPSRAFLLRLGDVRCTGFSPEIVATVTGREVTANPLAGTRALPEDKTAARALRDDLEWDIKECYEHVISARLVQEELGAVCEPGSVHVRDLMAVAERGTVQHLSSGVCGLLRDGLGVWDALRAVFPAVTASGIPKAPALRLIAALEPERGLYAGAVCMVGAEELDTALVLRAAYACAGESWLRAGAGVVETSVPEAEFEETSNKLASIGRYLVPQSTVAADSLSGWKWLPMNRAGKGQSAEIDF